MALSCALTFCKEYALPNHGFFRARLTLRNGDFLEVAEFFRVVNGQTESVEYRFQSMDPNRQTLRKRWDNATHHPGLPNFPHPIHVGTTGHLEPGRLLSILDLVDLIEQEIEHGSVLKIRTRIDTERTDSHGFNL